jgi:hypothetical protein
MTASSQAGSADTQDHRKRTRVSANRFERGRWDQFVRTGCDQSLAAVEPSRQMIRKRNPAGEAIQACAEDLPFDDRTWLSSPLSLADKEGGPARDAPRDTRSDRPAQLRPLASAVADRLSS